MYMYMCKRSPYTVYRLIGVTFRLCYILYCLQVNRSNLSAVIKRLDIETKIPTSQQTNLLRAAGIISVRGAPGRLIKVSDVQRVIDDFDIMLKIGDNISKEEEVSDLLFSEILILILFIIFRREHNFPHIED